MPYADLFNGFVKGHYSMDSKDPVFCVTDSTIILSALSDILLTWVKSNFDVSLF